MARARTRSLGPAFTGHGLRRSAATSPLPATALATLRVSSRVYTAARCASTSTRTPAQRPRQAVAAPNPE
eukprot:10130381-Alexandrium_andersonii.AAC.1